MATTGLLDLEKELNCSICTEVLYQPLTLLDCLHTFCGSCLKLWFAWQASSAAASRSDSSPPRSANPFTCPSCRAAVRGTRPDAKITTLLDMYLQANPSKARTDAERQDVASKYTPGESVLPRLPESGLSRDTLDRRLIEQARELSLRDDGSRRLRTYERGTRHSSRRREGSDGRNRGLASTAIAADSRSQARQIEHQASLRSLISTDDLDAMDMEEEILRQIIEEDLLDGIDLGNMSAHQEEELTERIAEAYRRRHGHSTPSRSRHNRHGSQSNAEASSRSPQLRPEGTEGSEASRRRRISTERRRQTSPAQASPRSSEIAVRSATDLSLTTSRPQGSRTTRRQSDTESRPPVSYPAPLRPSHRAASRHASEPTVGAAPARARHTPQGSGSSTRGNTDQPRASLDDAGQRARVTTDLVDDPAENASPTTFEDQARSSPGTHTSPVAVSQAANRRLSSCRDVSGAQPASQYPDAASRMQVAAQDSELCVVCERCGRANIAYQLHEHCAICKDGQFNLCHRCYRNGEGCFNWFGFGNFAWHRFQQRALSNPELPHALVGRRYIRSSDNVDSPRLPAQQPTSVTSNARVSLQSGAFCAICHAFADDCFWKCDYCNDGEWGFCNTCVNQGRCCTHPLLPLSHVGIAKTTPSIRFDGSEAEAAFAPITSPAMVQAYPPTNIHAPGQYRPLSFRTHCDVCRLSIAPTSERFHCYTCADGNYDICSACYAALVENGQISASNGEQGWRRCPQGHRMIAFRFEESSLGQARIITRELVGGHFLQDSDTNRPQEQQAMASSNADEWRFAPSTGETQTRQISRRSFSQAAAELEGASPSPQHQGLGTHTLDGLNVKYSETLTAQPVLLSDTTASHAMASEDPAIPKTRRLPTTGPEARQASVSPAAGGKASNLPPDGGVGMRVLAAYAWIPAEGATDELAFPRGAEIRETIDIANDWYQGYYAGSKGLFPASYTKVIGVVSMSTQ